MPIQGNDQTEEKRLKEQAYIISGVKYLGIECDQGKDKSPSPHRGSEQYKEEEL